MIVKYVLKNFSRRKVRTILMILSLLVSTGLIITMSATVATVQQSIIDLIANEVGRADLTITKKDTASQLFIPISQTLATIAGADPRIQAVFPRIELSAETDISGQRGQVYLVGLDSARDDIGTVEVLEGDYTLGNGHVAISRFSANSLGLSLGDRFTVAYTFPIPREPGKPAEEGISSVRYQRQFTVGAIVNAGDVARANGILVELSDLQSWLNLSGQANQMLVVVDPDLYATNDSEAAALTVRSVARAVQQQLGDSYLYNMDLAAGLSESSQVFLALQALINTYGLISLGVVGLLVHTLVMTNVQEQRRDMAVLRILGGQRNLLFGLIIVEVIIIGLVGVGLGIFLGQGLMTYVLIPLLKYFLTQEGLTLRLVPQLSVSAVLPPVISAFTVLILSSLKPATEASRTKVIHAINPSVADNIQLEDLTQLRERRPDGKMFLAGLAISSIFILVTGFQAFSYFGGEILLVVFVMMGLMGMVLGVSLMFFITTVPFERLVLAVMGLIAPRVTYFARRNVSRGKTRNTLIALLVLFSAVLPSFLGTQAQLELANNETRSKMQFGASVKIESFSRWNENVEAFKPSLVHNEFAAIPGMDQVVGLSNPYNTRVRDLVGFRRANVDILGVDGDLSLVVFDEMMEFTAGGPESLQTILAHPNTVIISEGLAKYLAVGVGDTIELQGEGLDHLENVLVVGIARRIPGINGITRSRIEAQNISTILVSMLHYARLVTELDRPLPEADAPMLGVVLGTLTPEANPDKIAEILYDQYGNGNNFWVNMLAWQLDESRGNMMFFVILLLALTGISFTTAVFAVFAVIYVTIYARRLEIGMLKAMGMLRRELNGMLMVEAIAMTMGSAFAGIAAGASMAYLNYYVDAIMQQMPVQFAVDKIATPAIIIMVVLASIMAAAFSARRIVRKQAVEILRMN